LFKHAELEVSAGHQHFKLHVAGEKKDEGRLSGRPLSASDLKKKVN